MGWTEGHLIRTHDHLEGAGRILEVVGGAARLLEGRGTSDGGRKASGKGI